MSSSILQYDPAKRARPLDYQKEGVNRMEAFLKEGRAALLADDMGLGKTLQTLWLLRRNATTMYPALVVCPASVKYTWEHQAAVHVNLRAQVLEGRTPPSGNLGRTPDLMVINPDILVNWLPHLLKLGIRTLIIDESQYFTNVDAKRTRAAIELAAAVDYRVALSGTPLTNRPAELWPVLHMLRPEVFPSFHAFAFTYCRPRKNRYGGWDYKGADNIDKLHRILKRTCMTRRLKKDVLKDLPSKVRRVLPFKMGKKARAEYTAACEDIVRYVSEKYGKGKARGVKKAEMVTKIGYLLRLAAKIKAKQIVQWVNEWLDNYPGEKIVVFGVHRGLLGVLKKNIKARSVVVDGSVTGRDRKRAVDTFVNDHDCRVFIGNIRAAGTGVDGLQKVASTLVFAELFWRPGDMLQAEDRIYRIGLENVAWIYYTVMSGTIEEHLCEVIQKKQEIITETLDGVADADFDIFDKLIEKLDV